LKNIYGDAKLFLVMGADSWTDIKTWKNWERFLTMTDHIVVSRPGYKLNIEHVTDDIRRRIVDLRGSRSDLARSERDGEAIYFTDSVFFDTSSTELREDLSDGELEREEDLPVEVANYIEKYNLY